MINNTIEMLEHEKDTCIRELSKVLNQEDMAECSKFMFKIKEDRHYKTMARQKNKLERLVRKNKDKEGGCINNKHANMQSSTNNLSSTAITPNAEFNSRSTAGISTAPKLTNDLKSKWVVNMSKIPLTEAQEKPLTHGPNFATTPRCPPTGEYIAVVEQTCQNLVQGKLKS